MRGLTRLAQIIPLFDERSDWAITEISGTEPATEGHYWLGAPLVAFDCLISLTDLILRVGGEFFHDIASQARIPCARVPARFYRDTVMCIVDPRASYERGHSKSLTRGVTSKVILAQQCEQLDLIRMRGFCLTGGEVDSGMVGLAASVYVPNRALLASLSLWVAGLALDEMIGRWRVQFHLPLSNLFMEKISRIDKPLPDIRRGLK